MEDTTKMGQPAIQRRDKAGTQDDRKDVQGRSFVAFVGLLQAIRYWWFRSLHRGLHVSPQHF